MKRLGVLILIVAVIDLCGRELARASLLSGVGWTMSEWSVLGIAIVGMGLVATKLTAFAKATARLRQGFGVVSPELEERRRTSLAEARFARRRKLRPTGSLRATGLLPLFMLLFAAGVVAQVRLGARLQSDGFYYYAYLRSIWFDRDVDFANDYRMLGLGDKPYLFEPTATGHAQSAWTIGPAIVWSPFFAAGHVVARALNARGQPVSIDGTSFPYRQAVCLAGLFYGLIGLWWCGRLAARYVRMPIALLATLGIGGGSFILWYLVKEPTMTHAPSLAAVAGFCLLWATTIEHRSRSAWLALGLASGLMTDIRWQNAIFCVLPAIDLIRARTRGAALGFLAFAVAAFIAFLPQMLAWHAIYGSFVAISPLGPQIRWTSPHIVDILWSSRNGLFATSPVTYVAAAGLIVFAWRHRRIGMPALAAIAAMVYFNAAIQDWWGSAAFGMRRFDGILPFLTIGLAVAIEGVERAIVRHPRVVLGAALGALVVWNLTFMGAALAGDIRIGEPISFARLAAAQAGMLASWTGHPFSYPINLLYALRHRVGPDRYDLLGPNRFLGDPARPYGRIDLGDGTDFEAATVGPGWHAPERDGSTTFRWAPREVSLVVPLDHADDLTTRLRLKALGYPGAPAQTMVIEINGSRFGPFEVQPDWHVVEAATPKAIWRAGANRVTLRFGWQAVPADVGLGGDRRSLSAAIDYFRVEKAQ